MKLTAHLAFSGFLGLASVPAAVAVEPAAPTVQSSSDAVAAEAARYIDYSKPYPWFPAPEAALTPEQRKVFDKLRAMPQYNPVPLVPKRSGTTAAAMDDLERRVEETLLLKCDAQTGSVTGRALNYTGDRGPTEPDKAKPANFITDFYPLFSDAIRAYEGSLPEKKGDAGAQAASVRARAAKLLNRLLVHFANQSLDGIRSHGKIFDPGFGYIWRNNGGEGRRMISAMSVLDDPAMRANVLENLIWMQGSTGVPQDRGLSTDEYSNTTVQHLAAVSSMRDCPAKWQRLLMVRYAMENSILLPTRDGTLSPDGGIIHHSYAHDNYGSYEFAPMCKLLRDLNDAGVPSLHADEVARRVARAGVAWSWTHQPATIVTNINGRPGPPFAGQCDAIAKPGAEGHAIEAALTLLSYKHPATWREDATRLLAIALAKNPATKIPAELEPLLGEAKKIADPLSGSLALPVSGAVMQRRDGWFVCVRGGPPGRNGGEGMPYAPWGTRTTYGGLYCKGSLMLVGDGAAPGAPANLVSSGQAIDGRDMSLMPGVTAPILPQEKMIGHWYGSGATFSAPVALEGQGTWGFATDAVAKSCFLFDNRITYATALLDPKTEAKPPAHRAGKPLAKKDANDAAPLATTFIQFRHADGANDPESFDGKPFARGARASLADDKPHTVLGAGGHGYYLHPTTERLELFRREQENRLCDTPKGPVYKGKDTQVARSELALAYKGDFTTGYWLHDPKAATRTPVVFTLLVKSGEAGLADFADRMKDPATAPARFTHSPVAHILHDGPTDMWGAVFFAAGRPGAGHELNRDFPVLEADRPCSVILKATRSGMTLAVSGGEELKQKPAPFTLLLRGRWKLAAGTPASVAAVSDDGGATRLVVAPAAPAGNAVELTAF